jgi:hypothetical protein
MRFRLLDWRRKSKGLEKKVDALEELLFDLIGEVGYMVRTHGLTDDDTFNYLSLEKKEKKEESDED